MEILLVIIVFLLCGTVILQSRGLMRQHVESIRADMKSGLQSVSENLGAQLNAMTSQIRSQTDTVGDRLDHATRVIGDVRQHLGELGQATREMKELGQNMSKLEDLLNVPRLRGGLGEFLLEDLLKQVLPAAHVTMQYRFRNGQTVDAVIHTSDRLVPVDSKFPLENFRRMVSAQDDSDRRSLRKAFASDVKNHIDAIATKYVCPDEGTFPFALMYIPAENIYYEIIIRDEDSPEVYSYAISKKVVPVSPNSFYAYLQVIALGLRGMAIENNALELVDSLSRLQGDMSRVRELFDVLGTHLENARKKYDEADHKLSMFEGRLDLASGHSLAEHAL